MKGEGLNFGLSFFLNIISCCLKCFNGGYI